MSHRFFCFRYLNENNTNIPEKASFGNSSRDTKFVEIKRFQFNPSKLNINQGTKVIWNNFDNTKHNVTFNNSSVKNSRTLYKNDSFEQMFLTAGKYNYYCTFHPLMKGSVNVI